MRLDFIGTTFLGASSSFPEVSFEHPVGVGLGFASGALVYYAGDRLVGRSGGDDRLEIESSKAKGSGAAMFVGALLDGIPEAFILGISFALGGSDRAHRRLCDHSGARLRTRAHDLHVEGLWSEAFAAGAVLTMLADSMMPEAFEHGGKAVGLFAVLGYLVAAVLSVAQ